MGYLGQPSRPGRLGLGHIALVLAMLLAGLGTLVADSRAAGPPLYPDLRTAPPGNLYLERRTLSDGLSHLLLRFDNTVENHGGRLEITADLSRSRTVYQNIYDQYSGGTRVAQYAVASDLLYHPDHYHFHFQDFAAYTLMKRDSRGAYRETSRRGTKTGFCIMDYVRIRSDIGPSTPQYSMCNDRVQGLSTGWGDTYVGQLPEQWIDLGTGSIADGAYAVRSVADPRNKLYETNNDNNTAYTYFTVRNGAILLSSVPPQCQVSPASGPVGTPITVQCTGFQAGSSVNIYWGSVNTTPKQTVTASSSGAVSGSFIAPEATLGNHYVIARATSGSPQAASLFATTPSLAQSVTSGIVGTTIDLDLLGFAGGESIAVRYFKTATSYSTLATVTANSRGSATASITVPASTFGNHAIEAVGVSSGAKATGAFEVAPSLRLFPSSGEPGDEIGPSLRGFARYETVTLRLDGTETLRTVTVSSTGSITATSASAFLIPANANPGVHTVTATGSTSGAVAEAELTVLVASASEAPDEPATPTAEASPTASPDPAATPEPDATATPEPDSETPAPAPSPTATVEPTAPAEPEPAPTDAPQDGLRITLVEVDAVQPDAVTIRVTTEGAYQVDVVYWSDPRFPRDLATRRIENGVAEVTIDRLDPATTYTFRVTATSLDRATVTTDEQTFTTAPQAGT